MQSRIGLGYRLWKAFIVQALLISLTAILGVFAARYVLGDVLIQAALKSEAEHYWLFHSQNADFPRPNTYNLTAYLSGADTIPDEYAELDIGFHEFEKADSDLYVVYVTEQDDERLWLEFDGRQVSELATFFGLIPLAIVLVVIYLSSWLGYRFSRQAVSPVILLARRVAELEPRLLSGEELHARFVEEDMDQEVAVLANALEQFAGRIEHFVVRERNFTRDASHELRSPITVIKIASDVILQDQKLSEKSRRYVERIKRSAADMEELIEALLLLARESEDQLSIEPVVLNDLVEEEIERAQLIYGDKPIEVVKHEKARLVIEASDKVLSVLIGNIIRNAFSYTDQGRIEIAIQSDSITIKDSGVGMSEDEVKEVFKPFIRLDAKPRGGYGVGLTIVKMLTDRFHWQLSVDSKPNVGTEMKIRFPAHSVIHY